MCVWVEGWWLVWLSRCRHVCGLVVVCWQAGRGGRVGSVCVVGSVGAPCWSTVPIAFTWSERCFLVSEREGVPRLRRAHMCRRAAQVSNGLARSVGVGHRPGVWPGHFSGVKRNQKGCCVIWASGPSAGHPSVARRTSDRPPPALPSSRVGWLQSKRGKGRGPAPERLTCKRR